MRFSEVWKTAIKGIAKNKRRSFLTMVGLIIGISAVITIFSIGRGFEGYISTLVGMDEFDDGVGVMFEPDDSSFNKNKLKGFTESDLEKIREIDGVKSVEFYTTNIEDGVKYSDQTIKEDGMNGNMSTFKLLTKKGAPVIHGRSITEADHVNRNPVVVIDEKTATKIREEKPESLIGQSLNIGGHQLEVVGIMADREWTGLMQTNDSTTSVETPENTFEHFYDSSQYNMLIVQNEVSVPTKNVMKSIENTLKDEGTNRKLGSYSYKDVAQQVDTIRMILTGITLLVSVIGGISLFISGVGVMNMIYISVSERTKEIGVRRAMGGTKGNLMMQFLFEGIALTLIGGTIGFAFSVLFSVIITIFSPLRVMPDLFTTGLAFGLSVLIGLIFSWLPAKSASSRDIVNLLK